MLGSRYGPFDESAWSGRRPCAVCAMANMARPVLQRTDWVARWALLSALALTFGVRHLASFFY